MYPCTKFKSFCRTLDYETKDTQKLSLTKIKKNKHERCNKHIAFYPCTNFQ